VEKVTSEQRSQRGEGGSHVGEKPCQAEEISNAKAWDKSLPGWNDCKEVTVTMAGWGEVKSRT
jgi:hypothetical protein